MAKKTIKEGRVNRWWSAKQVAILFGKNTKTIRRWVEGCPPELQLSVRKIGGHGAYQIPLKVIEAMAYYHCQYIDWSKLSQS